MKKNNYRLGSWITLPHYSIAEIMASKNFDWLVIDMEHSVIDYEQAQMMISIIQSKGKLAYVRVGKNDTLILKRVLDAGADGVVIPMVNSQAEAISAVDSVFYPPFGQRGVGLSRAQGYGFKFEDYLKKQKKTHVIVQIEHFRAVKNLESILSVEGIYGSIIGPYDLSASFGVPGNFQNRDVKNAIFEYEKISRRLNKSMGYHIIKPRSKEVNEIIKKGYKIIALGFDAMFLGTMIDNTIESLKNDKL